MKYLLILLAVSAAVLLLLFCKHQPKFSSDNLPAKQLRWGTGGGFAGRENVHVLLESGQLFYSKMAERLVALPKIKSKAAGALFAKAGTLQLGALDFVHPGNLYSFLEWHDGDAVRRIVWGDPNMPVDPAIQAFFDELKALVKVQ